MAFENTKYLEENLSPEELESKKELLLNQISQYGKTFEALEATVNAHEGQKTEYADLTKAIENKKALKALLEPEVSSLADKKNSLDKQIESSQATLDEKNALTAEIQQLRGMIKILQKEHQDFSDAFNEKKLEAGKHMQAMKEQLSILHAATGSVISHLE